MLFHLNKKEFNNFISTIAFRNNIDADIIEKDYYVCTILKELSKNQDNLKAYFKGGTAIYKILGTLHRFSEDIDLTVKIIPQQSNTQNRKRLKLSALSYNIPGLELEKDKCINNKNSITAFYKYKTIFDIDNISLFRANTIQIESTSFTVSEPTQKYIIQPLIYSLANNNERFILENQFSISKFEIEIIKLERMFIDKLFAAEFYYIRDMYFDTSKHLYDICILFNNYYIQKLLNNKEYFFRLVKYKRLEELSRIGGINKNTLIKDFKYFNLKFNNQLTKQFEEMQNKYVFNNKYKISITQLQNILNNLHLIILSLQ